MLLHCCYGLKLLHRYFCTGAAELVPAAALVQILQSKLESSEKTGSEFFQQVLTQTPVAKLVTAVILSGSVDAECSRGGAVHQLNHPT